MIEDVSMINNPIRKKMKDNCDIEKFLINKYWETTEKYSKVMVEDLREYFDHNQ